MDYRNILEKENYVEINGLKNFNIKQILECGQCFRFEKKEEMDYIIVALQKVIEVKQEDDKIKIFNTDINEVKELWIKYFDLEREYSKIKEKLSEDEILRKSIKFGEGIRILTQDKFEMILSFIISARNNIPSIRRTVNKISEKWGKKTEYDGKTYYLFPSVSDMKDASLEEIEKTGASFRSKYIYDTVLNIYKSETEKEEKFNPEYIASLSDDECHEALQEFKGVGAKVADCIMLFSMQKYSAFPVDVWVKRAMMHFYGASDMSLNKIRIFGRDKFKEFSGFAQQYLFYYARENNIKL